MQVSFDGGSTWKAFWHQPELLRRRHRRPERRHQAAPARERDGLHRDVPDRRHDPAATAPTPNPVGGFTATANGAAQIDLSWTAVTNRTRYQVDRATNSGFTTGVTLGVYTGTGTSFSDTGLTAGTTYYYRIKAVGTGRYSDTASYATANATPTALTARWILVEVDNNYETPGSGLLRFGEIEVDADLAAQTCSTARPLRTTPETSSPASRCPTLRTATSRQNGRPRTAVQATASGTSITSSRSTLDRR